MKTFQFIFVFLSCASVSCFSQVEEFGICGATEPQKFIVKYNDTIYVDPDIPTEFPGGRKTMTPFISNNLQYPFMAQCSFIGKCYLRFIVDSEGNISEIKILRGVTDCPECDMEAIKVIASMPKWIPAKVNGKPVKSYFQMPINFTIN